MFNKKDKQLLNFTNSQLNNLHYLAYSYGCLLNKRSELRKEGNVDKEINQRYYECYCKLSGAAEVLGLYFNIDYNNRLINFYVIGEIENSILTVCISNLVYERFIDNYEKNNEKKQKKEIKK